MLSSVSRGCPSVNAGSLVFRPLPGGAGISPPLTEGGSLFQGGPPYDYPCSLSAFHSTKFLFGKAIFRPLGQFHGLTSPKHRKVYTPGFSSTSYPLTWICFGSMVSNCLVFKTYSIVYIYIYSIYLEPK